MVVDAIVLYRLGDRIDRPENELQWTN